MSYLVKEIFGPTIQGEGAHAGSACVFLRLAACNLACTWCDTDFAPAGANKMTAEDIVRALIEIDTAGSRRVIVTGGEPALQWDAELASAIEAARFRTHMETNGTRVLAAPVGWLTLSPKPQFHGDADVLVDDIAPNECKVVVDDSITTEVLAGYENRYDCEHWFLQPCDGPDYKKSLAKTLELVGQRPWWRLSMQLHKIAGVP